MSEYVRAMRRRGLAAGTVEKRRYELALWLRACPGWQAATRHDVERWLDGRSMGPRSRSCAVSHLHAFYVWARREGLVEHDPTELVERPRLPRRLPRPARLGDVELALVVVPDWCRVALVLMGWAGLRCCEVARLDWRDVDLDAGVLWVIEGKGGADRVLAIPDRLRAELAPRAAPSGPVIGHSWSAGRVSREVNAQLRAAGARCTAHQLRHLYATRLLAAAQGNVLAVQQALGHASVTSTQIYAQVDPQAAIAAGRELV